MALAHDHTIMISDPKNNVYLNELANGFVIPFGMVRFMCELTSPQAYRKLVLAQKLKTTEAQELGVINSLYRDHYDLEA